MRILITGGRGIVGTALQSVLGREAIPLERDECDVTDAGSVGAAFESHRPEVVIHCAAMTNVDGCEHDQAGARRVNVDGTANVAQAARGRNARLILLGTDYVFRGDVDRPLTEDDPPGPRSTYGKTKLGAEGAAILNHPAPLIVRTCGVYGEGSTAHFPAKIAAKIDAGEPLCVVDDQVVSPTYALDLAGALARLARMSDVHGLYHAANSGHVSWFAFAREIARLQGKPEHPIEAISTTALGRPAPRPAYSALDSRKLARDLGILMRPWDEALGAYLRSTSRVIP